VFAELWVKPTSRLEELGAPLFARATSQLRHLQGGRMYIIYKNVTSMDIKNLARRSMHAPHRSCDSCVERERARERESEREREIASERERQRDRETERERQRDRDEDSDRGRDRE
jgi:hypothetical protein